MIEILFCFFIGFLISNVVIPGVFMGALAIDAYLVRVSDYLEEKFKKWSQDDGNYW